GRLSPPPLRPRRVGSGRRFRGPVGPSERIWWPVRCRRRTTDGYIPAGLSRSRNETIRERPPFSCPRLLLMEWLLALGGPRFLAAVLTNAKDAARFFVARFEFEFDGQLLRQPDRQIGERLADRERVGPDGQLAGGSDFPVPTRQGVDRRRMGSESRVGPL